MLLLFLFVRYQGVQWVMAYYSIDAAPRLPTEFAYPMKDNSCASSAPLAVVSYNVRYGSALMESIAALFMSAREGKYLPWSVRAPEIRESIASYAPDLIGLQETHTDADIGSIVPLSDYTLVSYRKGVFHYSDAALLFKTKRFDLLDSGQFWLSPTPDLPMAFGFYPFALLRYVNWAMLSDKSSRFKFLFVNTHFDNASVNKEPSATLFRERIAMLAKSLPVIVTGDFNSRADTERYRRLTGSKDNPPLLSNAYTLAGEPTVDSTLHPDNRFDHILAGGPCKVRAAAWRIDTRPMKNGKAMSDHDPVISQLIFTP